MKLDSAIILAGGKSIRMGIDKQKLKINDEYIIDKIINELKKLFS